MQAFVYVLKRKAEDRFKIGKAVDIFARARLLGFDQFDLASSWAISVPTEQRALQLEKCLHRAFDPWRIPFEGLRATAGLQPGDTEWFKPECLKRVRQFIRSNLDLFDARLITSDDLRTQIEAESSRAKGNLLAKVAADRAARKPRDQESEARDLEQLKTRLHAGAQRLTQELPKVLDLALERIRGLKTQSSFIAKITLEFGVNKCQLLVGDCSAKAIPEIRRLGALLESLNERLVLTETAIDGTPPIHLTWVMPMECWVEGKVGYFRQGFRLTPELDQSKTSGVQAKLVSPLSLIGTTLKDFTLRSNLPVTGWKTEVKGDDAFRVKEILARCLALSSLEKTTSVYDSKVVLTARQTEIKNFLLSMLTKFGRPPTRVEIAKQFGFNSPNAAEDHLRALEKKGVIELMGNQARNIRFRESLFS